MEKVKTRGVKSPLKLGEMLLKYHVITPEQLDQGLKTQEGAGGRLGRNLIQLGYISEDIFIKFLSSQLGISAVNLNNLNVPAEVQRLVPLELVQKFGVLPVKKVDNSVYLGMTDPTDLNTLRELEFSLGLKVVPLVLAESQWEFAVKFFQEKGWGQNTLTKRIRTAKEVDAGYDLRLLVKELISNKGSDIHLSVGVPPTFRIHDALVRLPADSLTPEKMEALLYPVLNPQQRETLDRTNELDFALSFFNLGRFRFNIYRQKNELAAVLRYINERIPGLEELNLPPWLADFVTKRQGLILLTGPSGHGKSTTMACLIDIMNSTRRVNIVTIEDPIEYVHHHKLSNVNQREVGTDTDSFHDGMKHIFRQDPDVICIGEMRDLESISTALTAAETGHLVMATLHTLSAIATIDRIIDVFPSGSQNQVRSQMAGSLLLIFSQRLVPRADGAGRILAFEKLANSYRVQNAIRENRTYLLKGQAAVASDDYTSIDFNLAALVKKGLIRYEEGFKYADDPKTYEMLAKK